MRRMCRMVFPRLDRPDLHSAFRVMNTRQKEENNHDYSDDYRRAALSGCGNIFGRDYHVAGASLSVWPVAVSYFAGHYGVGFNFFLFEYSFVASGGMVAGGSLSLVAFLVFGITAFTLSR